ncbi:MAG: hypothetical protein PHW98_06125 [Candidatus Omnitrophica bacterium]|nr:hypothetical protein [Candidatus Omnitrophota bacterium]MDD5506276.1 hypothetical protein [Candidatus Omnitrophota bacterium]
MVMHIDMDAFFASIEEAVNPRLKGKPLIIGSRGKKEATVVCAANYAAKSLGIHSGIPTRRAYSIYSKLEFVAADQAKYIWTSEQILGLLEGYGFPLNYASIDEFQMDLSGLSSCQNPVSLGKEIKARIYAKFNISASVGIAENWLLAKLASKVDKPDGLTIINDSNLEQILRRTSLDKLCGMGGKNGRELICRGLKTCWDLYLNLPAFFNNCGKFKENPGKSDEMPKSIGHSYTLPALELNPQVIRAWIRLLSEMVAVRLRQQGLISQTVHLWLAGPEIGNFGGQKTWHKETDDGYEIWQRALKIMTKTALKYPKIRAIGVTCSNLSRKAYQPLFGEEIRREGLIQAIDRINDRFGEGVIHPAVTSLTKQS